LTGQGSGQSDLTLKLDVTSLLKVVCTLTGHWTRWPLEIPFNVSYCMMLWFSEKKNF